MAPVPSTATAVDANLQRKQILEEVTLLTQKRDTLRDEHTLWAEAVDAVRMRYAAHTAADMPIEEVAAMLKENFRKRREELAAEILKHEISRDSLKNEVLTLQRNCDAVGGDLEQKTAELAAIEARIPERTAAMRELERQHTDVLLGLQERTATARNENQSVTLDTEAKRQEHADKTAWILKEEKRLSIREHDISIYELRVREAGKKLDSNFEMIL